MDDFSVSVTPAEERRLREFINALRTPCQAQMDQQSLLNSVEFESEFRSKLLTHHCFMRAPLFQESFDSAFIAACSHAGRQVEDAPTGQRFWDVVKTNLAEDQRGPIRKTLNRCHRSVPP